MGVDSKYGTASLDLVVDVELLVVLFVRFDVVHVRELAFVAGDFVSE